MDNGTVQGVGVAFEALLLGQMLRPMARGSDAFGEFGVTLLAQAIAQHDAYGFGALIAAKLHGP